MALREDEINILGLPQRPFFYTLDQIADLLQVSQNNLKQYHLHFQGRTPGVCPKHRMHVYDLSGPDQKEPTWRVSERDFMRWLRFKGIRFTSRGII